MSAPLTRSQKAYLAQLSERAFNRSAAIARGRGESPATDTRTRDTWRHQQVAQACGKLGLRCCSQDDYKLVEGHFLEALGDHAQAFEAFTRAATNDRRVAEYKLREACKEAGLSLNYANAICRNQNRGANLDQVDARVLWRLVYTIRNRRHSRHHQQEAA